jgi:hypothetical protein
VTRYRFLDPMGDVVAEGEFPDHHAALAWAHDTDSGQIEPGSLGSPEAPDEEIQRVEYLGPDGDWRWAGALRG